MQVFDIEGEDAKYRLHCKGASEIVLEYCTNYLRKDGESPLDEGVKGELEKLVDDYASAGIFGILRAA